MITLSYDVFFLACVLQSLAEVPRRHPAKAPPALLVDASRLVEQIRYIPPFERVREVNKFVNLRMKYRSDERVHGRPEYWQGPTQTLRRGTGDCEDAAILKIALLLSAKIPVTELALEAFRIYEGGWLPSSGHAVASWRNAYILDWRNEPIPRAEYYESYAKTYYNATSLGWWASVFPAAALFTGMRYDESIIDAGGAEWAWMKWKAECFFAAAGKDMPVP